MPSLNNNDSKLVIDSIEISKMMNVEHKYLLRKLNGDRSRKGIISILTEGQIVVDDYFVESTYKDVSGKENKCYLCTRLGCEFLANKFTGEKGILFTAKYVKRFNEMEKQLTNNLLSFQIEDPIERAKAWIKEMENNQKLLAEKDEIIEELSPLAKLARERIDSTGTVSITDLTKTYGLQRGQLTCWAKIKGFIHKKLREVNKSGDIYFKVIQDINGHKNIAIREEGIAFIDKNIDEIRQSPCKYKAEN